MSELKLRYKEEIIESEYKSNGKTSYGITRKITTPRLKNCPKCGKAVYINISESPKENKRRFIHPAIMCDNCNEAWDIGYINMDVPENSKLTIKDIVSKLEKLWETTKN